MLQVCRTYISDVITKTGLDISKMEHSIQCISISATTLKYSILWWFSNQHNRVACYKCRREIQNNENERCMPINRKYRVKPPSKTPVGYHPTIPKCHPTQANAHLKYTMYNKHTEIEQKLYCTKQNINLFVVCVLGFICLLMRCLAERDVSVFSLCRGIRSQVVKRQILQESKNETKCQKEKLRKSVRNPFSWAKPARYWPEFGEKDEARADAKLWIDFRSRLIVSEKIHACTPNLQEEG